MVLLGFSGVDDFYVRFIGGGFLDEQGAVEGFEEVFVFWLGYGLCDGCFVVGGCDGYFGV